MQTSHMLVMHVCVEGNAHRLLKKKQYILVDFPSIYLNNKEYTHEQAEWPQLK